MTKMDQMSIFAEETITEAPIPKPPSREARLRKWKIENKAAYDAAICKCSPSRANTLLVEQYEGNGPSDL